LFAKEMDSLIKSFEEETGIPMEMGVPEFAKDKVMPSRECQTTFEEEYSGTNIAEPVVPDIIKKPFNLSLVKLNTLIEVLTGLEQPGVENLTQMMKWSVYFFWGPNPSQTA
jgi:hypothetical protein